MFTCVSHPILGNYVPMSHVQFGLYDECVIIRDEIGNELYKKKCDPLEIETFTQDNGRSIPARGISICFIPVNRLSTINFIKDLTFPLFFNVASKVNNIVGKIFLSIALIFIDLLTLVPRLAILLFYRAPLKAEHPLIPLIKDHPQAKKALDKGYVEIIHQYREVKDTGINTLGEKVVENTIHEKITLVCIKELIGVRTKMANIIAKSQQLHEIVHNGVSLGGYRISFYGENMGSTISSESLE